MMRTGHRILLAAGIVLVLGSLALFFRQTPEPLPEDIIRGRVGEELGLTAADTLRIAAQSGTFMRVNLHSAEGGGTWVIVEHTATSTQVITKGATIIAKAFSDEFTPCNSPCWFSGTARDIIACKLGPATPPKAAIGVNTSAQKPEVARP